MQRGLIMSRLFSIVACGVVASVAMLGVPGAAFARSSGGGHRSAGHQHVSHAKHHSGSKHHQANYRQGKKNHGKHHAASYRTETGKGKRAQFAAANSFRQGKYNNGRIGSTGMKRSWNSSWKPSRMFGSKSYFGGKNVAKRNTALTPSTGKVATGTPSKLGSRTTNASTNVPTSNK